jgi:SAM-dependent methyltransferase
MTPALLFDRPLHRARLERAAARLGEADFLRARAAGDAVERLLAVTRSFPLALELGARRGEFARALGAAAPSKIGTLIESDLSFRMLGRPSGARPGPRAVLDEERLPMAEGALDLVLSLLSLHWTNDLVGTLIQIRRALKPDGLFLGAVLGGATLFELRQALLEADAEADGGAGPRVSPFLDAFDGAALLQRAGFALPVADLDRVTVRYAHPLGLLRDLRAMGETGVLLERSRRPLSRARIARMSALYRERFGLPDGRIPATFDIISLSGWAPAETQPKPLAPGSARVSLKDALSAVRRERERSPEAEAAFETPGREGAQRGPRPRPEDA